MVCMFLLMAVGSMTSCCHSRWETAITQDHFLFPHQPPLFWGESCILRKNDFYTLHVTKEKAVQLLSYGPHKRGGKDERKQFVGAKNAGIPIMTNLLKLEDQKSYFPLSLKITQWPLSFPS